MARRTREKVCVTLFGRCQDRRSICHCVDDFRPRLMYSADQVTEYGLRREIAIAALKTKLTPVPGIRASIECSGT